MGPVVWGGLSALAWGSADFMARFSTRAMGARSAFAGVLLVGSLGLGIWILAADLPLTWSGPGLGLAVLHGAAVTATMLLLYTGLARGPVSVVAPIVAAHPVFVLMFAAAMGLRPSLVEWAATAAILGGVALVSRHAEPDGAATQRRTTLLIAGGASLAYAVAIVAGQAAVPHLGEIQSTWVGRVVGLALLAAWFALSGERPGIRREWMPFVLAQGVLDTAGYLTLMAGARTSHPEAAVVVASTFGIVTVLLGRLVLKEAVGPVQWLAIAVIFGGTAVLASVT